MSSRQRIVVIGNGMAGARFAEDLVAGPERDRFELVMFGDEPYGNYNRILLSSVLAGTHAPEDIFMNPLGWYRENGIRLHAGVPVSALDRESQEVRGGDVVETYDHLVFATGSDPFVPPMEGLRQESGDFRKGVFLFRSLDDSLGMIRSSESASRAIVIGGGLLGLEAARGLLDRGLQVHVVELATHPMAVQLDAEAGAILQRTMEGMGVRMHVGTSVTEVLGNGRVEGVVLADGSVEPTDMLVISAGIRPRVALARDAGLEVERGIVVDDSMVSASDPRISALGECAQHRGRVYGLVAPAWEQAAVLARRLRGDVTARYSGSGTSTRLKVMGVDLLALGEKDAADAACEVIRFSNAAAGVYKKLVVREDRLVGAILLGDASGGPRLLEAFHRKSEIPGDRADLLFPPAAAPAGHDLGNAQDAFQVCNCNGVSKGAILAAVASGCRTLGAVCETTKAGTGCGSCRSDVQRLLESSAQTPLETDPAAHHYVPAVPMKKPDLVEAIRSRGLKSVSAVLEALGEGEGDAKSKIGLASLLRIVWGADYDDQRDARFINDRVHANIQRDGTFSVVPRILGGVVTPDQLRSIADAAEKYRVPMVKITGGQRIDLLGVEKSQLPHIWKDLGMSSGHAYTKAVRTVKTCVGEEFCRFGLGDSTRLGIDIERRYQGLETPHKVKMAVSACPRNCAESTTKDVGLVAIEGGRWEVYVGGAAGSRVRKGDVLVVVESHEDAVRFTRRFLQYYRENARYLERTYDFVERVGIGPLRSILVEDSDGISARLDETIEQDRAASQDPWREGSRPVHPMQFTTQLEPLGQEVIR